MTERLKRNTMNNNVTDRESKLELEDQLCFALYSTSRAITRQYSIILDNLGVTYPQYLALMVLWKNDGILIQEVANRLEIDQATATPLIQRLEKLHLVVRQRSTEDERKVQVFLTAKGRQLYHDAVAVPANLSAAMGVDEQQHQSLIEALNTIKQSLSDCRKLS